MIYYRLMDDINYSNRWYLDEVSEVDNWELYSRVPSVQHNLAIGIYKDGEEMDFTMSEGYALPVVSSKVKSVLEDLSDVGFIPLTIRDKICKSSYFVMVVKQAVDCVDEDKSEFQKFEDNDPVRPDKAGDYRGFFNLQINPSKVGNLDIIRIQKFETAIIVSQRVKEKLELAGVSGLTLAPVVT